MTIRLRLSEPGVADDLASFLSRTRLPRQSFGHHEARCAALDPPLAPRESVQVAPPISYARAGPIRVAYQVVDGGPNDLLMIPGWASHLALDWEEPLWVRWCERMRAFARLIRFDKRGTGLSDRPAGIPTLEERLEDAIAVMDAVGLQDAHVLGWSEGGPLGVLLAATHPERVRSLVLYGTQACFHRTDDYPWGDDEASLEQELTEIEEGWGTLAFAELFAPAGDARFTTQWAAYSRAAASPSAAAALGYANWQLDVRPLLSAVRPPALVLNRHGDRVVPVEAGRHMAKNMPGARFVELDGDDHIMWVGDAEALSAEIEHFITGIRPSVGEPGSVMTILHCDVEGSTRLARDLGDEGWADVLARYEHASALAVSAHRGRIVDRTGDGFMAAFPGPVAAVRAAQGLQRELAMLGVRVRGGIHIGEVVERNGLVRGIAVHVAARITSEAGGDEILVSETVKDIVAGSGLRFEDRGMRALKGIEEPRRLFAVA